MTRTATCHCGQLNLVCEGEARVSLCHCLDCQRRTGSLFSIAAFFPRDAVRAQGAAKTFTRDSASGFAVTFYFCPECGSNLYWAPDRFPTRFGVSVGAFADPDFPQPIQSVWTKDMHAWLSLPDGMAVFEMNSPPRQPAHPKT